jgi:hypothetical protein
MTLDEAREVVISGMHFAAYKETQFGLYESDMNRLFGAEHYNSGRFIDRPSPWAEGDFENKMATLLAWATELTRSQPSFAEAKKMLRNEDSLLGRVIRKTSSLQWKPLTYAELTKNQVRPEAGNHKNWGPPPGSTSI